MDDPPKIMWLTPLGRRLIDLEVAITNPKTSGLFGSYVEDVGVQLKPLRHQLLILYLVSFLTAFLSLGNYGSDVVVEAAGLTVPLGLFSKQAIAAITAGLFAQYIICMLSMTLLLASLQHIMKKQVGEASEFLIGKYDTNALYFSFLTPRTVGYQSGKREWAIAVLAGIAALASVLVHFAIVILAAFSALQAALVAKEAVAITLAGFSVLGTVVPAIGWFAMSFVPMPYRLAKTT